LYSMIMEKMEAEFLLSGEETSSYEVGKFLAENHRALRIKYRGDVAVTRAEAILKLERDGAYDTGRGWAVYRTGGVATAGATTVEEPVRSYLLMAISPDGPNMEHPVSLRLITNECFQVGSEVHVLSEDVTLDNENDAQFCVDAVPFTAEGEVAAPSAGIYFEASPGSPLRFRNYEPYTPALTISAAVHHRGRGVLKDEFMPFGMFHSLYAKEYALSRLRENLAAIATLEPIAHFTPSST